MFSVRIVTANHYVAPPIKELDATYSDFRRSEVKQVPVIRIFGATPTGQKTCLHIHGVFPYIYIPYGGTEPQDKYMQQIANSLDLAIQVSLGRASVATQHVFKISVVTGMPLYGYHTKEQQFLKIYFYNPFMVKRAVDLLQTGAVMNKVFQPYEAHIPYILQFLMDYNLYGMNLVNVGAVKFRKTEDMQESGKSLSGSSKHSGNSDDLNQSTQGSGSSKSSVNRQIWNQDTISRSQWLDDVVTRQSTCELEADAVAVDILNRLEIEGTIGANPGLVAIWEDEKQRREQLNQLDDLLPPSSPDRGDLEEIESEMRGQARLQEIIQERVKQLREAGCSEELTQSMLGEDSQSQEPQSPNPSSQIDFHLSQRTDEDQPPLLARGGTEPVVNEDLVQSYMEASQHSTPTQKQGSDKDLVQLLVDLAHSESQLEEPEDGSILSGQTPTNDQDDLAHQASQVVKGTEEDDEEEVRDALESLHMSQAWDEGGRPSNESSDDGREEENEMEEEEEEGRYDSAHSTIEELENALISITENDERNLPQYDGAGDEELATDTANKGEQDANKFSRRRNIQKPSRYLSDDDDFVDLTSIKPKSHRKKKKARPRNKLEMSANVSTSKSTTVSTKKSSSVSTSKSTSVLTSKSTSASTSKSTYVSTTDYSANEADPRDKLLQEFVIRVTDRHDEETIKQIPYWNPVLRLHKFNLDEVKFGSGIRNQDGRPVDDAAVWDVKEDSLSEGMVKKTLRIGSPKLLLKMDAHENQDATVRKMPVKKTLGVKRRRQQSDYTSDSSSASMANLFYSMRTKRERVMYREDDEFDEILGLSEEKRGLSDNKMGSSDNKKGSSDNKIRLSDNVMDSADDADDCFGFTSDAWQRTSEDPSPNRYNKAMLNFSVKTKSPLRGKKFISLSRKRLMQIRAAKEVSTDDDDDISFPEVIEDTTTDEENETLDGDCMSVSLKPVDDSIIALQSSAEPTIVSTKPFDDSIISLQSSAELSHSEQSEEMGVSSLPEKKESASGPSQDSIKDSNSFPTHITDNSRSRIYNSLPSSPKESARGDSSPSHRRGKCRTRGGKRQFGNGKKPPCSTSNVDEWGPPMFSISTNDSKEDYRDAMWSLAYFSPLRPEPEPSPPRAWSPTRTQQSAQIEDNDILNHLEGTVSTSNSTNVLTSKSTNVDILNHLVDNDQMMKEMAEFQEDHRDIFHQLVCQPATESILPTSGGDSSSYQPAAESILPTSGGDSSPSDNNKQGDINVVKDDAQTSMEVDVIPDSQSEEDTQVSGETSKDPVIEHNNNLLSKANSKETPPILNKEPDVASQKDSESVLSGQHKFDPMRTCKPIPLETRGDPSKKVIGTVHPTQHIKPQEDSSQNQTQGKSDDTTKSTENDVNVKQNASLIISREQSFSAELQSPIDTYPSIPSTSDQLSLMSPTSQPAKFFPTPKQSQTDEAVSSPTCADSINSKDSAVFLSEEKSGRNSRDANDKPNKVHTSESKQDWGQESSSTPTQGQRSGQTKQDGGHDIDTQKSDSSSRLTPVAPGQRSNQTKQDVEQDSDTQMSDSSSPLTPGQRSGQTKQDGERDSDTQMSDTSLALTPGQKSSQTKQDGEQDSDTQMSDSLSPLPPGQRSNQPKPDGGQDIDTQMSVLSSPLTPGQRSNHTKQDGGQDSDTQMSDSSSPLTPGQRSNQPQKSGGQDINTQISDFSSPLTPSQRSIHTIQDGEQDSDTQVSNSSSSLTPGQRAPESILPETQSPKTQPDSDDSDESASAFGSPIGLEGFLSPTASKTDEVKIGNMEVISNKMLEHLESDASLPSSVPTPWKTFTSDCMTPVKSSQDDGSTGDLTQRSKDIDSSQDEKVLLAHSGENPGWQSFSSDIMTPAKPSSSDLKSSSESADKSFSFDNSHTARSDDTDAKMQESDTSTFVKSGESVSDHQEPESQKSGLTSSSESADKSFSFDNSHTARSDDTDAKMQESDTSTFVKSGESVSDSQVSQKLEQDSGARDLKSVLEDFENSQTQRSSPTPMLKCDNSAVSQIQNPECAREMDLSANVTDGGQSSRVDHTTCTVDKSSSLLLTSLESKTDDKQLPPSAKSLEKSLQNSTNNSIGKEVDIRSNPDVHNSAVSPVQNSEDLKVQNSPDLLDGSTGNTDNLSNESTNAESLPLNSYSSTASLSLFDKTKGDDDVTRNISFQSKTSAFTNVKARVVLTDIATSKIPSIKRKLSELSDIDANDTKRNKSAANSQDTQDSAMDSVEDMSIGCTMDSVEDMSIGDSMSIPESPEEKVKNDSFHTPDTSIHDSSIKDKTLVNGDEHKIKDIRRNPEGQNSAVSQVQNSEDLQELVSDSKPIEHPLLTKGNTSNGEMSPAHQALVAIATKLMKPALDPPSMSSVKESLLKHGLYEVQHQKAFWSKPQDQPQQNARSDILHQTQPKSNVPSELNDAQTKLSDIGLHHWRTVMGTMSNAPTSSQAPNTAFNILHEMTNMNYRASMLGETNTVITPCKPPPSHRKVENWLNRKHVESTMQNGVNTAVANNEHVDTDAPNADKFKTPGPAQKDEHKHSDQDKPSTSHQELGNKHDVTMETVAMKTKDSTTTSTPLPSCFASPLVRNLSLSHSTPVRGPNSQAAIEPGVTPIAGCSSQRRRLSTDVNSQAVTEPGVTPIAGCSSQRRRLSTGDGPLANLVRRQSLFFTPRESIGNSQLLRGASDTSQIEGPTPNNTYNFKLSQPNLQDAKALHEVQHLTILSMELHVRTRRDYRPDPETDPIRAMFFCLQTDGIDGKKQEKGMIVVEESVAGNTNTAGTSSNSTPSVGHQAHTGIHELTIINAASEKDLFQEIVLLFRKHDPDVLVGYEIQQLSWGFLFQRAAFLDVNLCAQVSRLPENKKDSTFRSEKDEYGADHMSEIHIAGRIVLNMWRLMRHEVTLNIYTFENVTFHVLHQRVPKFSYRSLSDWFDHQTNVFRWRVVEYYTLRVCCNLELLEQRDMIGRTSELARVFGIQFYSVLSRGSQYRVESMMLRLAKPLNYIAVSPSQQQRVRMKAPECIPLVMEPESRFYEDPVIVVDFQSLYPSMMIAYNYCYSTCLGRLDHIADGGQYALGCQSLSVAATTLKKLQNSDSIHVSPNGVVFVKQSVRHGVLPRMLDQILSTRIMVKKALKDHKNDKILERMLDNRQLGLKLIANVTYGYTAASFSGRMPCIEVGDSVVRKGRETLERAIMMVESSKEWNARVVYGDTDSMFILLKGATKERAFQVGKEIAAAVTADNPKPVKLKFEKVYHPCVLQAKKRYVGFKYESPDQVEPEYDAKGIETVRRDGCPAVAKILERSIKALFTTKDMSHVKEYVQKQFRKIIDGSASMQDLTFAKEYRGRHLYQPGACVPALEISRRMLSIDRCSEPRKGERVPYVVVYGSPGLPLIQLVRRPEEVLRDPTLRLNSTYYISRQIIPALNRVFSLMGVDTNTWYQELPKNQRLHNQAAANAHVKKGTIAQYFSSLNCVLCDKLTKSGLCDSCQDDPQQTAAILSERIQEWNQSWRAVDKMCNSCCGFKDEHPGCESLDCPVRYKLDRTVAQLQQVPFYQSLLDTLAGGNTS